MSTPEDDSPGCDVTAPLASAHPEGPCFDSVLPLPSDDLLAAVRELKVQARIRAAEAARDLAACDTVERMILEGRA